MFHLTDDHSPSDFADLLNAHESYLSDRYPFVRPADCFYDGAWILRGNVAKGIVLTSDGDGTWVCQTYTDDQGVVRTMAEICISTVGAFGRVRQYIRDCQRAAGPISALNLAHYYAV
jgi:hypothetical protein